MLKGRCLSPSSNKEGRRKRDTGFYKLTVFLIRSMNISLSTGNDKKKKSGYGLNKREDNVFGGGSSDSEDDAGGDDRAAVNRDLKAEQEALRKRAAVSLESAEVYDYDGVYGDEMHAHEKKRKEPDTQKSRYIGDLLKAANKRNHERDIAYERKISREQAQEEAEFQGKDKFVTKAYKQKLAERELWAQEEEERRREEEKHDVTKKTGDGAFASFYGNLNRNVAMGGGEQESKKEDNQDALNYGDERASATLDIDEKRPGLDFMDGFEPAASESKSENESKPEPRGEAAAVSLVSMRQVRAEKLAKARLRYFQRQGLSEETAGQSQ
jgi:coiled-coil domain-containing protein 55